MSLRESESNNPGFYEQYSTQQVNLASYCSGRFIRETMPNLPQETHVGINTLLEKKYARLHGTNRVLGGYLVPWAMETVGDTNEDLLEQASYATFLGRFWFILYDHQMDEPKIIEQLRLEQAIKPLFDQAQLAYQATVGKKGVAEFDTHYERLLQTSLLANQWEMDRRDKVYLPYSEKDMQQVGNKISVVNWTTHALAIATNNSKKGQQLEQVMNHSFVAIQVNHDVTDAKQDLKIRNCTYPIAVALNHLGYTNKNMPKGVDEDILTALYSQSCMETIIETVNKHTQEGIDAGDQLSSSPFITHLQMVIDRNNRLLEKLSSLPDDDIDRSRVIISELKNNQGDPNRHAISLD